MTESPSPIEWVRIGEVRHELHNCFWGDVVGHHIIVKTMVRGVGERRCYVPLTEYELQVMTPGDICRHALTQAMLDVEAVLEGKVELPADQPIEVEE